ncbi:30S ribosomal protein S5 [Candidatus Gracilibacteria bacterium]|nr:30S ribosomal protein S5 [Candidatus Gracilibacteria bacterium]
MQKKGKAPIKETKEFEEEVIQIDRVTRVVKGGRRLRFRATVVIGNKKGKVGVGIGKSTEVTGAIQKAVNQAKKSLIHVPVIGQTIPHRVSVKYKSAKLLLLPACPGTGIIAGGPLRKVLELAGVQDVLSKSLGCNNRVTNSQAAMLALAKLKSLPWIKTAKVEEPVKPVISEESEDARKKTAPKAGQVPSKPQVKPAVKPQTSAAPKAAEKKTVPAKTAKK